MSQSVPRYLRIECPNGQTHHVELTGGQYCQGDVNVWVAHDLGKVSETSAVCSLSFLLFCGARRLGEWRRLPHNSLLAHNLEPGCWRVSFMDSLGISASLLSVGLVQLPWPLDRRLLCFPWHLWVCVLAHLPALETSEIVRT
jgi:hypothetical protein